MSSTAFPGWYVEFQAALLRQAPRPGEIDQVTAESWANNQSGLKKTLGCLLPPQGSILEFTGTINLSATGGKFVASRKFVRGISFDEKVKIVHLGSNFISCFSNKIEDQISAVTLRFDRLRRISVDTQIITELGGDARAETTLTEMFSLMKIDKSISVLLKNGDANIFYIRDVGNALRVVYVHWKDGWVVDSSPVGHTTGWSAGRQVFYRFWS